MLNKEDFLSEITEVSLRERFDTVIFKSDWERLVTYIFDNYEIKKKV